MMHPADNLTVPLKKKEIYALIEKAQAGDRRAKDKVILSYYRFTITCANKYFGRGVPMEDMISEAQIGLSRAVELFDVNRGLEFGSYAVWWIRSYIISLVQEQGLSIRVPANFYYTGKNKKEGYAERDRKIIEAIRSSPRLQHENEFENSLASDDPAPDSAAIAALKRKRVDQILSELPPRDADILRRRYGIGLAEPETLRELGESLGVSRERIRQIENISKRELKKKYRGGEP